MIAPAADLNQNVNGLAADLKESVIDPAADQRASGPVVILKEGGINLKEKGIRLERGHEVRLRVKERGHVTGHVVSQMGKDPETDPAVSRREIGRGLERDPEVSPKGTMIVPEAVPEAEGIVPEAIQTLSGKDPPIVVPDPLPHKKMERKMPDPGPSHQWQPLPVGRVLLLLLHAHLLLPVPDLVPAPQSSLQRESLIYFVLGLSLLKSITIGKHFVW